MVIQLTAVGVAAAIGIAAGVVSIGTTLVDKIKGFLPDNEADRKEVKYLSFKDNQPSGGFRLILVNEKTGWNKAVRIYTNPGGADYKEVKAGDSTGTVCKGNMHLKYDSKRVDFPSNKDYITLNLMKPGTLGIYSTVNEIRIYKDKFADYNGQTFVVYWQNDNSGYFSDPKNFVSPADM
ncbi:hypothetical protein ACTFIV_000752 [Dictyostelium citrinum]